MNPFRFGVIGENTHTPEKLLGTALRAEALGYSTFLLRDHFVPEPFGEQFAPLPALTAAAAATSTIRVGTMVIDNDYRHPVMLAKEVATVDQVSAGRFELGIGAGWLREEYDRAGMPFESAGVRVSRFVEAVQILHQLFAGDHVSFAGEHYKLNQLATFPAAVQPGGPPIAIGAGAPRMLAIAGRLADTVGLLPRALPNGTISEQFTERSADAVMRKIDFIAEAAGDRFEQVELSMIIHASLTDDYQALAQEKATKLSVTAEDVLKIPSNYYGPVERIIELMIERRQRYGFSYFVVQDSLMEQFAPVVEALADKQ